MLLNLVSNVLVDKIGNLCDFLLGQDVFIARDGDFEAVAEGDAGEADTDAAGQGDVCAALDCSDESTVGGAVLEGLDGAGSVREGHGVFA